MYAFAFPRLLTPTRLRPKAQGLAASATLGFLAKELFNRKAVASFPRRIKIGATGLRLEFDESLIHGSRSDNPGLKDTTALRLTSRTPALS